MKLHAKEKPVIRSSIEKDNYHCCQWCGWYDCQKGMCVNPVYSGAEVTPTHGYFIEIVEDGRLSDTLTEALHNDPEGEAEFESSLTTLLREWGVSDRRVKSFKTVFRQALDQYLDMRLKGTLDEHLSKMVQSVEGEMSVECSGTHIEDVYTHYCREFR